MARRWFPNLALLITATGLAACTAGAEDPRPTIPPDVVMTTTLPEPEIPTTTGAPGVEERVGALVGTVLVDGVATQFTISVEGDWLIVTTGDGSVLAFDAHARTLYVEDGDGRTLHRDLAPSGPDSPYLVLDRYLPLDLAARGLEKLDAGRAREGWRLDAPAIEITDHFRRPGLEDGAYGDGPTDHVWATLDRETLLPLYVVHASDQRPHEVMVRTWVVVTLEPASVDRRVFRPRHDADEVIDHGFDRVDLDTAARRLGYAPPRPSWLPERYEAVDMVVAGSPLLWWSYPSNPPSEAVTVLTYRRGPVETLTITARSAATGEWSDPYHRGDTASEGFFHDAPIGRFRVVSGPWPFWPVTHAWGTTGDLVISVGGHVSVEELLRLLDGLEL